MRYSDLRYLSHEDITQIIRDEVDNMDSLDLIVVAGHSQQLHCNQTSGDILNRVMHECKSCSSFAEDTEPAKQALENGYKSYAHDVICAAIYNQAEEIADWLDEPARKREKTLSISVDMGEPVGTGITMDLKEKETSAVRVVLGKSSVDEINAGSFLFFVKTAYPDLDHESARETGRTFGKEAREIYNAEQDELLKGFWALKAAGYSPSVGVSMAHGKFIDVPFTVKNRNYSILFNHESRFHRFPHVSLVGLDETGKKYYEKVERIDVTTLSAKEKQESYDAALSIQERFISAQKGDATIFDNYIQTISEKSSKSLDFFR